MVFPWRLDLSLSLRPLLMHSNLCDIVLSFFFLLTTYAKGVRVSFCTMNAGPLPVRLASLYTGTVTATINLHWEGHQSCNVLNQESPLKNNVYLLF